jgi:hypothetical protein
MSKTLDYLQAALKLAPAIIQTGSDIAAFASQVYTVVTKDTDPTEAEWKALTDKEDEMRAILQAPTG